jgi:hypothetical protein
MAGLKAVCTSECAAELAIKGLDKLKRKSDRERKKALLTASDWTKKAQVAFNAYIRERDGKEACISCGRLNREIDGYLRGGKWDAGHYRSRGACPELRFEPSNCHKQCKSCNGGSGKYTRKDASVGKEYRVRLIEKIGLDKVEWIEGQHGRKRYRIDDLKEIERHWKAELKKLKEKDL